MKKEAAATKPQAVRLRRRLGEVGRTPFLPPLPLADPEGEELLLVLLGDPEPELLEPPGLLELELVLAGGATEGNFSYVNGQNGHMKTDFQRS